MRRLIFLIVMMMAMDAEATHHWMAPGGTSTNDGAYNLGWHDVTLSNAFGTLQAYRNHTSTPPTAGDTLLILGGTYSNTQYFMGGTLSGTRNNPFVIKAAGRMLMGVSGDGRAVFRGVRGTSSPAFFGWTPTTGDAEHCVIDGFSAYDPDSAYYIYIYPDTQITQRAIELGYDGLQTYHLRNFTVRGVQIDYRHNFRSINYPFNLVQCDSFIIDHVNSQWAGACTGNRYKGQPGACPLPNGCDCTWSHTADGDNLLIKSCSYGKILNSTFKWGNQGNVLIGRIYTNGNPIGHVSTGITLKNCIIENFYGGGLFLVLGSTRCLVEGNWFVRIGEGTSFPKPEIQCTGSYNTIRGNIFHSPMNAPVELNATTQDDGVTYDTDYNYIYNNTMFENGSRKLAQFLEYAGSVENNVFSNNILYKPIYGWCDCLGGHPYTGLWLSCPTWNTSTWGNSTFRNNLINADRVGTRGADYPDAVVLFDTPYSINYLNGNFPGHWSGNISGDPRIWSENPDTLDAKGDSLFGAWGWFKLKSDSPCIDKGIVVHDANGEYVRNINANWGWYDLPYYGSAPDIGAYEYRRQSGAPPIAPLLDCRPGRR